MARVQTNEFTVPLSKDKGAKTVTVLWAIIGAWTMAQLQIIARNGFWSAIKAMSAKKIQTFAPALKAWETQESAFTQFMTDWKKANPDAPEAQLSMLADMVKANFKLGEKPTLPTIQRPIEGAKNADGSQKMEEIYSFSFTPAEICAFVESGELEDETPTPEAEKTETQTEDASAPDPLKMGKPQTKRAK